MIPERQWAILVAVLGNGVPVVGVTVLGWNATALLFVYCAELGVVAVWAGCMALVAEGFTVQDIEADDSESPFQRFNKKRGGFRIWSGGPALWLRNIPEAASVVLVTGAVGSLIGLATLVFVVPSLSAGTASNGMGMLEAVFFGILGLCVGRGVDFGKHILTGAYREDAPDRYLWYVLKHFVLGSIVIVSAIGLLGSVGVPSIALAVVVLSKVAFDVRDAMTGDSDGEADAIEEPEWLRMEPAGEPLDVYQPRPLLNVAVAFWGNLFLVGLSMGLFIALLFALHPIFGVLGILSVFPVTVLLMIVRLLTLSEVEYQIYDEAVVAYDGLTDTVQWVFPYDRICSVEPNGSEPAPGRSAVKVEAGTDGQYRRICRSLADATALRESIESRAGTAEPETL